MSKVPGRGAWKFEQWLDKQKSAEEFAAAEYKKAHPDRYFVAFLKISIPRSTLPEHVWPTVINETLIFEQPEQVTFEDIMRVAKKAWLIADDIAVTNFYEMSASDFSAFVGCDKEWGVIEE
jgi:hypothetical protein